MILTLIKLTGGTLWPLMCFQEMLYECWWWCSSLTSATAGDWVSLCSVSDLFTAPVLTSWGETVDVSVPLTPAEASAVQQEMLEWQHMFLTFASVVVLGWGLNSLFRLFLLCLVADNLPVTPRGATSGSDILTCFVTPDFVLLFSADLMIPLLLLLGDRSVLLTTSGWDLACESVWCLSVERFSRLRVPVSALVDRYGLLSGFDGFAASVDLLSHLSLTLPFVVV